MIWFVDRLPAQRCDHLLILTELEMNREIFGSENAR